MAKFTIKGNSWMPKRWQEFLKRTKLTVPLVLVTIGALCLTGGLLLANATTTYTMTQVRNGSKPYSGYTVTIGSTEEMAFFSDYLTKVASGSEAASRNPCSGVTFRLTADVELPAYWKMPELYGNTFDGDGYTVSGLHDKGKMSSGLFETVEEATVKNLTVRGELSGLRCGGITAVLGYSGKIVNCTNYVSVSQWNVAEAGVTNLYAYVGGIAGFATSNGGTTTDTESGAQIIGCKNYGTVTAEYDKAGGTGGILGGVGSESSYEGGVSCGYLLIENCRNYGTVSDLNSMSRRVGGIIGEVLRRYEQQATDTDQLVVDILSCSNSGTIIGSKCETGGIVGAIVTGNASTFEELTDTRHDYTRVALAWCSNSGTVKSLLANNGDTVAKLGVGGLVGFNTAYLSLVYCSNSGDVLAGSDENNILLGGLVGNNWITQLTGKGWGDRGFVSLYQCANYGSSNAAEFGGILANSQGDMIAVGCYTIGTDKSGQCRAFGDLNEQVVCTGIESFRTNNVIQGVYCYNSSLISYEGPPVDSKAADSGKVYYYTYQSNTDWTGPDPYKLVNALNAQSGMFDAVGSKPFCHYRVETYQGDRDHTWSYFWTADRANNIDSKYFDLYYVKLNPLYWGIRQNVDAQGSGTVCLGLQLKLDINLNGSAYCANHVWQLLQNDKVIYDEYMPENNNADYVCFRGVVPGEYQLSCDGVVIDEMSVTAYDYAEIYANHGVNCFVQESTINLYDPIFYGTIDGMPLSWGKAVPKTALDLIYFKDHTATSPEAVVDGGSSGKLPEGLYLAGWTDNVFNALSASKDTSIAFYAPGSEVPVSSSSYSYYPVIRTEGAFVTVRDASGSAESDTQAALYLDGEKVKDLPFRADLPTSDSDDPGYYYGGDGYVGVPENDGTYELWVESNGKMVSTGKTVTYVAAQHTFTSLTVNRATVTYVDTHLAEDAQTVKVESTFYGKALETPDVGEFTGYAFLGWTTQKSKAMSGDAEIYEISKGVNANTTLYAAWQKLDGAAVVVNLDDAPYAGREVTMRQQGEKIYTLEWKNNAYKAEAVANGTYDIYVDGVPTERSIEIKNGAGAATVSYYTVEFYYKNSESTAPDKSEVVLSGRSVSEPDAPTYAGHIFGGWFKDEAGQQEFDFTLPIDKKTAIYAFWRDVNGVTVRVTLDGGEYPNCAVTLRTENEVLYGSPSSSIDKINFYWERVEDGVYSVFVNGVATGRTVTVVDGGGNAAVSYYTVTFHPMNGTEENTSEIVILGGTVTPPEAPTCLGRTFGGWYADADCKAEFDFTLPIDGKTDIYAGWLSLDGVSVIVRVDGSIYAPTAGENLYSVKIVQDGADTFELTYDETVRAYSRSNSDGKITDGVYTVFVNNVSVGRTIVVTGGNGASVAVDYYTVTCYYNDDDGKAVTEKLEVVLSGSTVSKELPEPDPFFGWYLDAVYSIPFDASMPIVSTTNLYAKMQGAEGVTIYVTLDGGGYSGQAVTLRQENEILYGQPTESSGVYQWAIVADDTYDIYLNGENTGRTLEVKDGNGTAQLTCYTVRYFNSASADAAVLASEVVISGNTVKNGPPEFEVEGEIVSGWYTDIECTQEFDPSAPIDTTTNVYPGTEVIEGVLISVTKDGAAMRDAKVTLRQEDEPIYELVADPESTLFKMKDGEYAEDGEYNIFINGEDSGRTVTVENHSGSARVSLVTVRFFFMKDENDIEDSELYEEKVGLIGSPITPPIELPELTGQNFLCWTTEDGKEYDFSASLDGKLDLYGRWEVIRYSVICEVENVELDGKSYTTYFNSYYGVLVPEEGFLLPEEINVTMDEEAFTDFTYDSETGEIVIFEKSVSFDIVISGEAIPIEHYLVTSKIKNCVLYGAAADTKNGYHGTIKANTGYSVPTSITALMNDEPFTDFTYDSFSGRITILGDAVAGPLEFSGECKPALTAGTYNLISVIDHGKAAMTASSTASALQIVITPDAGYTYPSTVLVVSGNKRFTDFTYDERTGTLTIGSDKVTEVILTAICPKTDSTVKTVQSKTTVKKVL